MGGFQLAISSPTLHPDGYARRVRKVALPQ